MSKLGLVLEGGGMRGIYTAGVLDFFMEQNLYTTVSLASAQVLSCVQLCIQTDRQSVPYQYRLFKG